MYNDSYLVFGLNTFIYIVNNDVIIYNTLTWEYVESVNNKYIADLFSKQVIVLTQEDRNKHEVRKILKKIQTIKAGRLVSQSVFKGFPLNALPNQPLSTIRNDRVISAETIDNDYSLIRNSSISSLVNINSACSLNCDFCQKAFKQFSCCTRINEISEIGISEINKFLSFHPQFLMQNITISGGNIFLYSKLKELVDYLNSIRVFKRYIIYFLNINPSLDFSYFNKESSIFEIIVSGSIQLNQLVSVKKIFETSKLKYYLSFMVSSNLELENAEKIIDELQIINYQFRCFYDETNLSFFKKNVFLDKQEILNNKTLLTNLFRKRLWNENYNNHLTMNHDGQIYTSLNYPPVGDIYNCNWDDINNNVIETRGAWFLVRNDIAPCNKCLYALLCPSPGNYEHILGRNNLCNLIE